MNESYGSSGVAGGSPATTDAPATTEAREGGGVQPDRAEPAHRMSDLEVAWHDGNPPRLVVRGEIDLMTESHFERAVSRACDEHPKVVLDLSRATFISSRAIGSVFRHSCRLTAVVVDESTVIARALNYAGLPHRTAIIHVSADEAAWPPTPGTATRPTPPIPPPTPRPERQG